MQKTVGLILKKQDIGETDRILTVFLPDLGKKRVIARAVRRPLSKLAGHLDIFMLTQLMLTDEKDLPKVAGAVLTEPFASIRESLPNLKRAYAITRIIERVIVEDINQRSIFYVTLDALSRINAERSWQATWLSFLSQLTDRLGLGATDFRCEVCGEQIKDGSVWHVDDRRFRCAKCPRPSGDSINLEKNSVKLLQVLRRKPFETIEQIKLPEQNIREVEELLLREITQWFNKPWQSYASFADLGEEH